MDDDSKEVKPTEVGSEAPDMSSPGVEAQPQAPVSPDADGNNSSKKGLVGTIIAIVVAVLVLGGGVLAYNLWYQNPDRVIANAITNAFQAESSEVSATVSMEFDDDAPINGGTLTIDGVGNYTEGSYTAGLEVDLEDTDNVSVTGNFRMSEDGDWYLRAGGLQGVFDVVASQTDDPEFSMYASIFEGMIDVVDDQWIRIDADDLDQASQEVSELQECYQNLVERISDERDDLRRDFTDAYRNNIFIDVEERLGSENGSLGYVVGLDYDALRGFAEEFNSTELASEITNCLDTDDALIDVDAISEPEGTNADVRVELWISRWTHQLSAISVTIEDADGGDNRLDARMETSWNVDVEVEIPEDSMTFEELMEAVQEAVMQMYLQQFEAEMSQI